MPFSRSGFFLGVNSPLLFEGGEGGGLGFYLCAFFLLFFWVYLGFFICVGITKLINI